MLVTRAFAYMYNRVHNRKSALCEGATSEAPMNREADMYFIPWLSESHPYGVYEFSK